METKPANLGSRFRCVALPHVADSSEWEIDIATFWTCPVIVTSCIYSRSGDGNNYTTSISIWT